MVLFVSPLLFASITLKKDACGYILDYSKVYVTPKAEDTLGEMSMLTCEIH